VLRPARKLLAYLGGEGLGPTLVRGGIGSGAVQLSGMAAAFAVGILLARILGVQGYGYYGIAIAVISIAGIPAEFGLPQLVVREVAAAGARKDDGALIGVIRWANRTALALSLISAAVVVLIAQLFPASSPLPLVITIGAPIIPLLALARVRGAALQGLNLVPLGQMPSFLLRPLFFASLLFGSHFFSRREDAAFAVALNALATAAVLASAHILLRPRLKAIRSEQPTQTPRKWIGSALSMGMTTGMSVVQAQLAIFLLGIIAPPDQVGLFRLASSTVVMMVAPITLISMLVTPVLARLYAHGDNARLKKLCQRSAQLMTVGVAAFLLPFVLFGPSLIAFVFGPEFAPAYGALMIMAIGQLVNAGFGPNGILLNMSGHEKRVTRAMLFALMINAALIVMLAPSMGQVGAAWASSIALFAWNVLAWSDSRRFLGLDTSALPTGVRTVARPELPGVRSDPT
jgi:O-antigen/teichoic acid export membrane protein